MYKVIAATALLAGSTEAHFGEARFGHHFKNTIKEKIQDLTKPLHADQWMIETDDSKLEHVGEGVNNDCGEDIKVYHHDDDAGTCGETCIKAS